MIVIASHDDVLLLQDMLNRLSEISLDEHEIMVVNTNSQSTEYKRFWNTLPTQYPNIRFETKTYYSWDTGAYIHGYRTIKTDKYIFLQDSLYINNPNFFLDMNSLLDKFDVVPIFKFKYDGTMNDVCVNGGLLDVRETGTPEYGIFGPIFGVNRHTLDKIPDSWFVEPTNKPQAECMERRWALMFHQINASFKYFCDDVDFGDFWARKPYTQYHIKKIWRHRTI